MHIFKVNISNDSNLRLLSTKIHINRKLILNCVVVMIWIRHWSYKRYNILLLNGGFINNNTDISRWNITQKLLGILLLRKSGWIYIFQ